MTTTLTLHKNGMHLSTRGCCALTCKSAYTLSYRGFFTYIFVVWWTLLCTYKDCKKCAKWFGKRGRTKLLVISQGLQLWIVHLWGGRVCPRHAHPFKPEGVDNWIFSLLGFGSHRIHSLKSLRRRRFSHWKPLFIVREIARESAFAFGITQRHSVISRQQRENRRSLSGSIRNHTAPLFYIAKVARESRIRDYFAIIMGHITKAKV